MITILPLQKVKKFTEDGSFHFKKHKIYLYKEDFVAFAEILGEMTSYYESQGEEISDVTKKISKKEYATEN
jgi:hypothetical protein